jgi:hypothetical protein
MKACLHRIAVVLTVVCALNAAAADAPALARGSIVFRANFDDASVREQWQKAAFAKWTADGPGGSMCLAVDIASGNALGQMVGMPFDFTPYRGMELYLECKAKAADVTKPAHDYNGVKFMLHCKSASTDLWKNPNNLAGTFDWKTIGVAASIPHDAAAGELLLGLQESSGKAWFSEITVTILKLAPPVRPAPDPNAPPPYTGHTEPRLRGMMSPGALRKEDLQVLGTEWNANLIRWQITRNWGKAGTEMDLAEYDRWFDGKLDELDAALAVCKVSGLKAVIDVHTPPGGRDADMDMVMFLDKKYQDHFVLIWEKIARRFKGNPSVWAYDLVNEPLCRKRTALGMDSLATQVRAAKAVRAIDSETTIIVESEDWDSPSAYAWLTPIDVPHVVYQVHMYEPHEFTHQGVHGGNFTPVEYPGKGLDKEALRRTLQPVRDFQRAYNVQIYVGEFSAIRWAPGSAKYLEDCVSIFEEYGWDWSYHAFREWSGWSVEYENSREDKVATTDTDRKKVLLGWFRKNEKGK